MGSTAAEAGRELRWRCPSCGRAFRRAGQQHSCRSVALEDHVAPSHPMRALFDHLLQEVEREFGTCEVICLPCCIHLAGRSEFAAVLPRKRHLEVRFSLPREIEHERIERAVRTSTSMWKHSVHLATVEDVGPALLAWLREADDLEDA